MSGTSTPAPVAHLTVEHYYAGDVEPTSVTHHEWVGYTAADVIRERVAVFKGNRSRYKRVDRCTVERYCADGYWYRIKVEDVTS